MDLRSPSPDQADAAFESNPDADFVYFDQLPSGEYVQVPTPKGQPTTWAEASDADRESVLSKATPFVAAGVVAVAGNKHKLKGLLSKRLDRRGFNARVAKFGGVVAALSVGVASRGAEKVAAACGWFNQGSPFCGYGSCFTCSNAAMVQPQRCSCSGVPSGCTAGSWRYVKIHCCCP